MRIGIIGGGVVGKATARAFIEHVEEVCVYDVLPERRTHGLDRTVGCNLVFVCLPSPQEEKGLKCDTSMIDEFFSYVTRRGIPLDTNYVLRSTVPIGTTRMLAEKYGLKNLVHSPEFITARCSLTDAQIPARNIIGNPGFPGLRGRDTSLIVERLYKGRFPGVPCLRMNSDESEAVKLFTNGFFAVKVAYFNEIRTLADKLGLNWDAVIEGVLSDGRIAHAHTKVPGPDGKYGFGGACLPKDLANLMSHFEPLGLFNEVTRAAYTRNRVDQKRPL